MKSYKPTERHKKVYRLRIEGASYASIGEELGVTRQRAQQLYLTAKQRIEQHENQLPVDELVRLDNTDRMEGLEPDIDTKRSRD